MAIEIGLGYLVIGLLMAWLFDIAIQRGIAENPPNILGWVFVVLGWPLMLAVIFKSYIQHSFRD